MNQPTTTSTNSPVTSSGNGTDRPMDESANDERFEAEPLRAPLREFDETYSELNRPVTWYSRVVEFVEENPTSTAAGVAGAFGVLLGAGMLGKKILHPDPTPLDKIQSKVADALCGAAEILGSSKQRAEELTGQAAERSAEFRGLAEEKLSSVSDWLKKSAAELADELPGELERAGKRGIEAMSKVVKERPSTIGIAAAAALMAFGAFAYSKNSGSSGSTRRPGSASRSRKANFDDNTREELYEQAKKMGIPGRSSMSKEELIDALKHH